jgi:hypothetical protein
MTSSKFFSASLEVADPQPPDASLTSWAANVFVLAADAAELIRDAESDYSH